MIAVRDLQIGDFINTENNGVVQITVLSWRGVGYEGGASTPEHCSYIPLTEEILVKNGFGKVNNQYFFGQVEIKELRDYWVIIINKEDADVDINIHYVHQLQRILNLCNIDKEIIL